MSSTVGLFVVLVGVVGTVSVSADIVLQIGNPNGLMAELLPNAISVTRQLPTTTISPPSTPAGTQPPPMMPPLTPGPNQTNTSGNPMPPASPPSPTGNAPPPTGSVMPNPTMPATTAPLLTTGMITVTVASIRELDSNFTEVTSTPPHNFRGPLARGELLPYTPLPIIPDSNPPVQVDCQTVANLLSPELNATLKTTVCGIKSNGTVNFDTESSQVARGQLGFQLQIAEWPWTQTGSYLEFKINVSVMAGRTMSVKSQAGQSMTLGLGTLDSYTLLSAKVKNSSATFVTMPNGYPMLTQNNPADNTANVTAMFPRGSQVNIWNAVIEPGYQPFQKPPGPVSAAEGPVASWMIQVVTAALACWIGSMDRRQ